MYEKVRFSFSWLASAIFLKNGQGSISNPTFFSTNSLGPNRIWPDNCVWRQKKNRKKNRRYIQKHEERWLNKLHRFFLLLDVVESVKNQYLKLFIPRNLAPQNQFQSLTQKWTIYIYLRFYIFFQNFNQIQNGNLNFFKNQTGTKMTKKEKKLQIFYFI